MHPLRKAIVTVCLLLLLIGAFIQPALAQSTDGDEQPKALFFWRVSGNFENNRLNLKWIVTEVPGGSMVKATDVIIIDISDQCTIGPGIDIYDNVAHFSGQPKSGIVCHMPNFPDTVKAYLGPVMKDDCQCNLNTVIAPFAAARFAVPTGSGKMPLLTWSSMQMFVTDQQTFLHIGDNVFESNAVAQEIYRSTFIGLGANAILHYLADLYGSQNWWLWHKELQEAVANPTAFLIAWLEGDAANVGPQQEFKYELDPNEQLLYIGVDPVTGRSFKGAIALIKGDPGCFGSGGNP